MVLKVSKHGVRSGNTFKAANRNGFQRHYRKEAIIVRNLILNDGAVEKVNILGDIDVHQNRVPYSINKKGRWKLPDIIKRSIEEGDFDDEEFAVQVVERHKILGGTNCISIHTSKNPNNLKQGKRGIHRKIGYLNATSILTPKRYNLTRRERQNRWRRGIHDHDEIEEPIHVPSSVRYEVLYLPSSTSGINYAPRYTGFQPDTNWGFYCGCRRRCNCHNKTRGCSRKKCREEILEETQYLDYEDFDEENEDGNGSYLNEIGESSKTFLLEDFLSNTIHKETQRKRKRKFSDSKTNLSDPAPRTTTKVVVVAQSPQKRETIIGNAVKDVAEKPVKVEPVLVSIRNEEVYPDILKKIYGDKYVECACFPRKFIIDITDRIRNTRTSIETDTETQVEINACVVFCLDIENEVNNKEERIYRVILNTDSLRNLHTHRVETLFDYMKTTVEECLERTVFYVETLPEFVLTTPKSVQISKKHRVSNIEKSGKWESEAYAPSKSFCYSGFLAHGKEESVTKQTDIAGFAVSDMNNKDNLTEMSSLNGKLCDICYESLSAKIPGTCVISCGHWFCDGCWAEYLESRIDAGATRLTCPEFDCDNVVDSGTVVSLVSLNDVIRYAKICHDNNVERGDNTKWCPNKRCGRVVKVNSEGVKTGKCECGHEFCFDCLRQPHWPAPCESFMDYYKRLEKTGDIGLAPVESTDTVIVNGKNCPHCKKFVEKNGGCPYMACVCGNSFCWGCGKDWSSNTHDNSCFRFGVKNDHNTSEVTIEDDRTKRNFKKRRWYNIAVKHRVEQHQLKVEKLKAARKALVKYLSTHIGRSAKRGINVLLNFKGQKTTYRNEQEKLTEYVNELIELHQELNSVAEYTAVLIESGKLSESSVMHLQYVVRRLSSFSEGISNGFLHWIEREPEDLLAMFKKTRIHSYRTIKHLLTSVKKLEL